MTEKELIGKIRELRQIRPRKDWVLLTKTQILGEESIYRERFSVNFFPAWRPVLATVTAFGILFGIFSFAQNSLPGDPLYPLKKIVEKSQVIFVSEREQPKINLELANKRLEDLNKIAQTNRVRNLAPAISEFQENLSRAAKKLSEAKKPDVKEIVQQTKKLEENKQKIEALGIVVGETEELNNALAQLVEREIKDLEGKTLTEEQQGFLAEAKELYEAGIFAEALEKILFLSNQ